METSVEIQKSRIIILEAIYQITNGLISNQIDVDEIEKKLPAIQPDRINSEIFYLVEQGYLNNHFSSNEWDKEIINVVSLTSKGADLIQKIELGMDISAFNQDFSKEATSIINISQIDGNSSVIVQSHGIQIHNQYGIDDLSILKSLIDSIVLEAEKKDLKDIASAGNELQKAIKNSNTTKDYLKGMLNMFLSISNSIAANLITPDIQTVLDRLMS